MARALGLRVSGTLGLLLALVEHNKVSLEEGQRLLAEMRRYGYRCPVSCLRELF